MLSLPLPILAVATALGLAAAAQAQTPPLTADFTIDPAAPQAGQTVAFTSMTSGGGTGPVHTQNLPLWERMEALGIESGRLGSERADIT